MDTNAQTPYGGRLGLTTMSDFQVTGTNGDTFRVSLYTSINLTRDPDIAAEIDDQMHVVSCPESGDTYSLAVPYVVHDEARRLFVLVIPDALRHREFAERTALMEQLEKDPASIPAYVRDFKVVFDFARIEGLSDGPAQTSAGPDTDLEASKDLARRRAELEEAEARLAVEREQLNEVRERLDRERVQMDSIESRLVDERAEMDALRNEVEIERMALMAEQLNAEGRELSPKDDTPEEVTQIVTDDQFIEVVSEAEVVEELAAEVSELEDDSEVADFEPDELLFEPLTTGVPNRFEEVAGQNPKYDAILKIVNDRILAVARAERDRVKELFDVTPALMTQLHVIDGYPVVGLTLAHLDEHEQPIASIAWALDITDSSDSMLLDRLEKSTMLRVGLYNPAGSLMRAAELQAPLSSNLRWIRSEAARILKESDASSRSSFEDAAKKFIAPDFERIGTMRHNFQPHSFTELDTPSEAKLAAGIVGFWSTREKFTYLIANRAFPYTHFREIQERVVRAAVESGIALNEPLRDIAIEIGIALDEEKLLELLIANFAEVCISIRENDLDAGDQWDNWDALLGLGEDLGVPPDPDVVELAEVSLKRAQELAELDEIPEESNAPSDVSASSIIEHTLVVAKRSESTGVTYFLPEDAIEDSFDDLASMPQEDLELLLKDHNGRLEAAQMLIERFGDAAAPAVFAAAEEMNASEVASLARFVETKADGLEGELVRCLEAGGPSTVYIAATGLAAVKSTTALPTLLDALKDPKRRGDYVRLARMLASYGDKVLPSLSRAIKRDGSDDAYVALLAALEDIEEGTLNQLSKDRSKALREAARLARELRE